MAGGVRQRFTWARVSGMTALAVMFAANVYAEQSAEKQSAPTSAVPMPVQPADEAYRTGKQFEGKKNYVEAMRWYRKAADQGHALAQVAVGDLYGMAHGVAQDYGEALSRSSKSMRAEGTSSHPVTSPAPRFKSDAGIPAPGKTTWVRDSLQWRI